MTVITTELQQAFDKIVQYLPGWQIRPPENAEPTYVVLVDGPGGAQLVVHEVWDHQHRAEISGTFPREYTPRDSDRLKITIDYTRDPAKVAADIQRRLLPAYLGQYDAALVYKARQDAYDACEEAMLKELEALFGAEAHCILCPDNWHRSAEVRVYGSDERPSVTVTASGHSGKIRLLLSDVPFHTAKRICQLVADLVPQAPGLSTIERVGEVRPSVSLP